MRKNVILIAILLISSLMVIGCSNNEEVNQDNNGSEHDEDVVQDAGVVEEVTNLTFSEAIEEYPVWLQNRSYYDDIERTGSPQKIFVFEDETVTIYDSINRKSISFEEIQDLSNEEIIEIAENESYNVEEHEYTLTHTLDDTGQEVEFTTIDFSGDRDPKELNATIVSQPLYDEYLAGFETSDEFGFFTMVEDESVRIRLGDPEEDAKENITVE